MSNQKINPADIKFTASDEDMPQPKTKNYNTQPAKDEEPAKKETKVNENDITLIPSYKFNDLFHSCLGKLPYSTVLTNQSNDSIKLIDLMRFVETKHQKMTVGEMNKIISFIMTCPFEIVRPLMELVDGNQQELWSLVR